MKKIFNFTICALIAFACVFGFSACGEQKNENAVNLVSVEANNVGLMPDIDFYVVPEPAASAKVKAISGLNMCGDIQKIYGGEKGYPQAVVVAKNELLGTSVLSKFISSLEASGEWLMNEDNSIEAIVNSIQKNLTNGMDPSIKTQNLSRSVIENCGIHFVSASESKTDIISFMEKLNSVSEASFGMPSDSFFWDDELGAVDYSENIFVYAPDGAPALGLACLMSGASDNLKYEIVNPNTIQQFVGGAEPKADICVLPVNLAVKLLGNGEKFKLIGTLTHGNLYILSKSNLEITAENLHDLNGKTVGVVNLAAVPGLTVKLILKSHGIDYIEVK